MNELFERLIAEYGLLAVVGILAILLLMFVALVKSLRHTCGPNEFLIFSGRNKKMRDGTSRGFRVEQGGGWRNPILEKVDRMSLNTMEVPIAIRQAFSKGGIALNVDAIANVKISSDELAVTNAIERFLGRDPNEIRRVAKETLEGHLRGVLARLTPEEINEDRLKFAEELLTESENDLRKLGIHLDTLKIQHVSDDKHYLDSIGREMIANVIKEAEIAESNAQRDAALIEASNKARASVKQAEIEANIAKMRNELRKIQADLESNVRSEEERMLAAAREARATAEQELQQVRAVLEGLRLQSDQVLPAEAELRAQEYRSKGQAAILRERGAAAGQALDMMNEAWKDAGESALSIYMIENIEKLLATASKGVRKVSVKNVHVVDDENGQLINRYFETYPQLLHTVMQAIGDTTGLDVRRALGSASAAALPSNGQVETQS